MQTTKKWGLIFCVTCCLYCTSVLAQTEVLSKRLLEKIDQLQVKSDGIFLEGLFPSYRIYALNKERQKADPNIFYTGLIAFTLRDLLPFLHADQQKIASKIIEKSFSSAEKFRNVKGTYHFWRTDNPQIFPNSGWLNWLDKRQSLPADIDDTAIMLLAKGANPDSVTRIHQLMQHYANGTLKQINNIYPAYSDIGAYSTWMGEKMPIDLDVCVLSNVLLLVQRYDLKWTKADSASLDFIAKVINDKKHITDAAYVSPHYNRTPVILYHLARLMAEKPIPALENYKPQLIAEATAALNTATLFMDKILLSTALLRWGVVPKQSIVIQTDKLTDLIEEEQFYFFIANMASMFPSTLKRAGEDIGLGKFYYYCPAYHYALVLEYLLLSMKKA